MPQPFINPNYLNTYPNAYPYQPQMQPPMDRLQQLQAPYQMQQQTQVPQVPQTNQGILWVQGEAGAKSYLVAPSTSILLMDSENEYFTLRRPMRQECQRFALLNIKRLSMVRKKNLYRLKIWMKSMLPETSIRI